MIVIQKRSGMRHLVHPDGLATWCGRILHRRNWRFTKHRVCDCQLCMKLAMKGEQSMSRFAIPRIHGVSKERSRNTEKAPAMPSLKLIISGEAREKFGYIVTAREQDTDERWVIHRPGKGAIAEICEMLDRREGDWRILTISTPESIYRDLQGTRGSVWRDEVHNPEPYVLQKVKRLDLLDPFHTPAVPRGQSHA